ncbi:MAG: hypothetical protein JWQ66_2917 [Mucilaginibacter sp.]|nr:hypothetical protein [Mucilaginibacter sp.]
MTKTTATLLYPMVWILDVLTWLFSNDNFKELRKKTRDLYAEIMAQ